MNINIIDEHGRNSSWIWKYNDVHGIANAIPIITVDSRGCGQGKTLDGIYPKIDKIVEKEKGKYLLVLPSKDLQAEYKKEFARIHKINHETSTLKTTKAVANAMSGEDSKNEICITRQTFEQSRNLPGKDQYNLIIDEIFDNIVIKNTIQIAKSNDFFICWENMLILPDEYKVDMKKYLAMDKIPRDVYFKLSPKFTINNNILNQSLDYKKLTNPNYDLYITPYDYAVMWGGKVDGGNDNQDTPTTFNVHGVLTADILIGWKSIYVAAAAFEKTFMRYWLDFHHIPFVIEDDREFQKHTNNNVKIHYLPINRWTKSLRNNQRKYTNSYEEQFIEYVRSNIGRKDVIVLRNNGTEKVFAGEIKVAHNAHGQNKDKMQNCQNIVIMSAINPDDTNRTFIQNELLKNCHESSKDEALSQMYAINNFYQIAFRSSLRNCGSANIFVMDQIVADGLSYYFENATKVPIPLEDPIPKSTSYGKKTGGRKTKSIEEYQQQLDNLQNLTCNRTKTGAERSQLCKLRSKIEKLGGGCAL